MSSLNPKETETILVIDDDPIIRNCMEHSLLRHGFNCLLAENGQQAIDLATNYDGTIHLAILDLIMPEMTGDEVFSQLRLLRPKMKIIICSGYTWDKRIDDMLQKGAHSLIKKPFSLYKFTQEIALALQK